MWQYDRLNSPSNVTLTEVTRRLYAVEGLKIDRGAQVDTATVIITRVREGSFQWRIRRSKYPRGGRSGKRAGGGGRGRGGEGVVK